LFSVAFAFDESRDSLLDLGGALDGFASLSSLASSLFPSASC
jgi:hypothetical protein